MRVSICTIAICLRRTRIASLGSLPLIAAALAAVRLSTSSVEQSAVVFTLILSLIDRTPLTNHDHDKSTLIIYHVAYRGKQFLNKFARLGKPLGEQ